ncbi:MAG TPA: Pycsar system effector family protein, partial [Rhodanobacteraceae bacterium]|nr:Pycsar system effector family protein [Rhodanobacteraceae bacterium]
LREIAAAMKPDGSVYETMANDLYSIGWYLAHRKYRYLRYSYLFFLAGFVLACAEQGWMLMTK